MKALEEGKQTILFLKNGIRWEFSDPSNVSPGKSDDANEVDANTWVIQGEEKGGEFKPEYPEFFLYPTLGEESSHDIKPDWRPRFSAIESENKDPKRIHFRLYAVGEQVEKITDWEICKRLIPFTVLSDEAVEKKFHEGDWQGVYLFLIRVFSLPVPMDLPVKPSYEGCEVWVPLETSMFTAGSMPVIPDGAWPYTRDRILKMCETS